MADLRWSDGKNIGVDKESDGAVGAQTRKMLTEVVGGLIRFWMIPLSGAKTLSDGVSCVRRDRGLHAYADIRRRSADYAKKVLTWILTAQSASGGIRGYYSLLTGFSSEYPETTGYLLPTLFDASELLEHREAYQAGLEAGDWLLEQQLPSGAFRGGFVGEGRPPVVFNSGQVLHGLVRLHEETGSDRSLVAARSCGDWLLACQDEDGAWRRATYMDAPHSYHSMVGWALASLWKVTGLERFAEAAGANIEWVCDCVDERAWPSQLNLGANPSYLHFLAYVVQGLVETGLLLDDERSVKTGTRIARHLLRRFEFEKALHGAYNPDWTSDASYWCLVGNAQISCVWMTLYEVTEDWRYLNAALKINELLKERVVDWGSSSMRGGVPGSFPIWGGYQPYRLINWGAKFVLDALLGELAARSSLRSNP